MGRPTEQAKRAIEALKAAGYARKEFTVNTDIKRVKGHDGKYYSEYGNAIITVWANLERQYDLIGNVLEQGLSATVYILQDGTLGHPHYHEDLHPWQLTLVDLRLDDITFERLDSMNDIPHWREML